MFLLAGLSGVYSQSRDRKWSVGLHFGTTQYAGDGKNDFFDFNSKQLDNNFIGGLSVSRYLNRYFDAAACGYYGTVGYYIGNSTFKAKMTHVNLALRFKLANGTMLRENSRFQPYVFAGGGYESFEGRRTTPGSDVSVVTGAGLNVRITDAIGVNYQLTYMYVMNDERDLRKGGRYNDAFLLHTVGIYWNIGKAGKADCPSLAF